MGRRRINVSERSVPENSVYEAKEIVDNSSKIIESIVDEIVSEQAYEMDKLIDDIKYDLKNQDTMAEDDLMYYISVIPTEIYFLADRAENIGILSDSSKALRKEKYDDLYLKAIGKTVADKTSETNKLVMSEIIIENAYKRAYKKIQSKLDIAELQLNSLKKVLQWRTTQIELSSKSFETGGNIVHGKRQGARR